MTEPFQQLTSGQLVLAEWQRQIPGLRAGFTTRGGGHQNSFNCGLHMTNKPDKVMTNREALARLIDIPLTSWVFGEQTHKTNIHMATKNDKGKGAADVNTSLKGTDGLLTNDSGVLCAAVFADCVPIYFLDPATGYLGIAHAGWKGTVARMAQKMVEALKAKGARPSDIWVAIGPCISRAVYEVDAHVAGYIPDDLYAKTITPLGNNRFLLDLKQLNIEILLQQGILRHNIDVTYYCTFRDESQFFSHRRDQGETGRMLGYIGKKRD